MVNIAPPKGIIELKNYIEWLAANKIEYRVLSAGDKVDGTLILSGGPDIGINKVRDELEFEWLKQAIEGGYKVLGICRGMQLINIHFGGTVENLNERVLENHLIDQFADDECHNERLSQFHWVKNIKNGETFIVNQGLFKTLMGLLNVSDVELEKILKKWFMYNFPESTVISAHSSVYF